MNELYHYGTPRHSGRYPWGSGDNPYQHSKDFLYSVSKLKEQGLTESDIAKSLGMSISELRSRKSYARSEVVRSETAEAVRLREKGASVSAIAERLGKPERTVYFMLNSTEKAANQKTDTVADILKQNVADMNYVDIGKGVAEELGVSATRLDTAVQKLEDQGYTVHTIHVQQLGVPGQYTTVKVLAKPGTSWNEVSQNRDKIGVINQKVSAENNVVSVTPIKNISSSKVKMVYAEDGGSKKDGIIEIRRGAEGLDLGNSKYAQVRIGVDGTHYLKGIAVYSDDLPDGVDIRFNTSKSNSVKKMDVLKKQTGDASNPFNATIKAGGQKGYLNIIKEEGDWSTWTKTLASQMLSKQPVSLAKKQLGLVEDAKELEYKEISELTNPTVKKHMLIKFADSCDSDSVHLEAAALPRQSWKVILPVTSLKENEIYAPSYKNGESVVLIRYPHAGTFEIPELTVNNNNREAQKSFKNALDAVGINSSTAAKLSGADFDGDTVLVIPNVQNGKKIIKTSSTLKGLENFDPMVYQTDHKTITKASKGREMGVISNLITDMTIKGATADELARAVRHSMVVIDSEKKNLDYKKSYSDNNIAGLVKKYQQKENGKSGGASTLISRSTSTVRVPNRQLNRYSIDPNTGEKVFFTKVKTYTDSEGKVHERTSKTTQMENTSNAYSLSSGYSMENVYAEHANALKSLANKARKDTLSIKDTTYSPSAAKLYSSEVKSLNTKLGIAKKNAPLERKAQLVANKIVALKKESNPTMTKEELKKVRSQSLAQARASVGKTANTAIKISDDEWTAIQSGAVSKTKLEELLTYSDEDDLSKLATPRSSKTLTNAKLSQAKARLAMGYTLAEVAESLGVSVSTLTRALNA